MARLVRVQSDDLSIVTAVEALSAIADLELNEFSSQQPEQLQQIEHGLTSMLASSSEEVQDIPLLSQTIAWLHKKNAERVLDVVRSNFRTVLHYLKQFYHEKDGNFIRRESVEGVKTIMVLVGEAAENLDRYARIFLGATVKSVKETQEYLDLCTFYKKKIAPLSADSTIASWISALPLQKILSATGDASYESLQKKEISTLHQIVDLEGVKRDTDYELFYLKRPDGSRYFTSKLIRNMKLVSHVEEAIHHTQDDIVDISFDIQELNNSYISNAIETILTHIKTHHADFFTTAKSGKTHPLVKKAYSMLVALMYADILFHSHHDQYESGQATKKFPIDYYMDFQVFVRELFQEDEYKKLFSHPHQSKESWELCLMDALFRIGHTLATGVPIDQKWVGTVKSISSYSMQEALQEIELLEDNFIRDLCLYYLALHRASSDQERERISRLLAYIEGSSQYGFDPYFTKDLPTHLFNIRWNRHEAKVIRLPCPTFQNSLEAASLSPIFKLALKANAHFNSKEPVAEKRQKWVILNLQESCSFKDAARSRALHDIEQMEDIGIHTSVITMPREGDFYWQRGDFSEMSDASIFIEHLLDFFTIGQTKRSSPHLHDGIVWSLNKKMIDRDDVQKMVLLIHRILFADKEKLSRSERQNFIEYAGVVFTLLMLHEIHPTHLFIASKDGLDASVSFLATLYVSIQLLRGNVLSGADVEWMVSWLHGFELVQRGRVLLAERHTRFISFARSCLMLIADSPERREALISSIGEDKKNPLSKSVHPTGEVDISAIRAIKSHS